MYYIDFILLLSDNLLDLLSKLLVTRIMSPIAIKERLLTKKLLCTVLGHRFITSRNVTHHFKEYKCTVCQLELTNDEKGQITFLTPELKEINETLIVFYKKRFHSI
jgi:hypothetical protein